MLEGGLVSKLRLKTEHKAFLVVQFALWRTPTEAADAFLEEFGIEISRQAALVWDIGPERPHRRKAAPEKLVALFDEARERAISATTDVPVAHQAYRLREIQGMYKKARGRGNDKFAAELLEQAAKESGGAFTNKRDLTSDGKAIKAIVGVDLDDV